jgi:copper chaperone CopZ
MKTVVVVSGMTCNHCVQTVTTKTKDIPGVSDVSVELVNGGKSTVIVEHRADDIIGPLAGAIADAGYTLEAVLSQS